MRTKGLVAIRHAPTAAKGLCVGRYDVDTLGSHAETAEAIASELKRLGRVAQQFSGVWSSPLQRCASPARIFAQRERLDLCLDDRLCEISMGRWEGRSWTDIQKEEPAAFDRYMKYWQSEACPGGESPEELLCRVRLWYESLAAPGHHLLVAHAGVVRALRVLLGATWGEAMAEDVPYLRILCASRRFRADT